MYTVHTAAGMTTGVASAGLAMTGFNTLAYVVAGLTLVLLGFALVRTARPTRRKAR